VKITRFRAAPQGRAGIMNNLHSLGIRLEKSGSYWVACWRTNSGRRKRKSLGSIAKTPKRLALAKCRELAALHITSPSTREAKKAPTLKTWLDEVEKLHPEWSESTCEIVATTGRLLIENLGSDIRIDRISRACAGRFRAWLAEPTAAEIFRSEATIRKYIRQAKSIFGEALRLDLIPLNPFDRQEASSIASKNWEYIDAAATAKIIDECPDDSWRHLVGLCRWAGLRRGEAIAASWSDIDWQARTIRVDAEKTGAERFVPLEPRLYSMLAKGFEAAPEGSGAVCSVPALNLNRNLERIIKRAGVPAYARAFHTLRKNLETDWLEQYPVADVCKWLGHSPTVSMKHYHQTRPESIRKVTGEVSENEALRAEIEQLKAKLRQFA